MPYRGFSGGGFVGDFLSTTLLEQLRPAADNAGRQATVGSPATRAAPYRSDGESWKAVALIDDAGSLVSGDGNLSPFGARRAILSGANAGENSGWLPLSANPERFVYQLDSGTTTTTFSVDISADGATSLGQAFTGTYASSTVAEITPPIMFSNPLAKFFRWNVVSGGPLSVSRGA